jgi:hypothetical protein
MPVLASHATGAAPGAAGLVKVKTDLHIFSPHQFLIDVGSILRIDL